MEFRLLTAAETSAFSPPSLLFSADITSSPSSSSSGKENVLPEALRSSLVSVVEAFALLHSLDAAAAEHAAQAGARSENADSPSSSSSSTSPSLPSPVALAPLPDEQEAEHEEAGATFLSTCTRLLSMAERHQKVLRLLLAHQPDLLVGALDFIITSPTLAHSFRGVPSPLLGLACLTPHSVFHIADLLQGLSFDTKSEWFRRRILLDQAMSRYAGLSLSVARERAFHSACAAVLAERSENLKGVCHSVFSPSLLVPFSRSSHLELFYLPLIPPFFIVIFE